jgi:capsular exopolysaccharide synthesis family protein
MGKTYEALERAEREYEVKGRDILVRPAQPGSVYPHSAAHHAVIECYEELKTNLFAGHHGGPVKTILFSGTNHGDGSSTTAINFATTLAEDDRIKVLLMDVNLRTPSLHGTFHLQPDHGLSDLPANGRDPEALVKKVPRCNLYVVTCGSSYTGPLSLFQSTCFCEFLKLMKTKFDYVILDGPPTPTYSETRLLCSQVDGVVMVLAAGKTREQVAKKAKQEIEEAGGKILGLVLNRRKFHIPEWLYRRL